MPAIFRDVQVSKLRNNRKSARNATSGPENRILTFVDATKGSSKEHGDGSPDGALQTETENMLDDTSIATQTGEDTPAITSQTGIQLLSSAEPKHMAFATGETFQAMPDESQGPNVTTKNRALQQSQEPLPHLLPTPPAHNLFAPNIEYDSLGLARASSDRLSATSFGSSPRRWIGTIAATRFLDQMVKPPSAGTSKEAQKYQETVLLRYFHEELAPWFDLCDPDRHFTFVLPRRAREAGPLRSAILTISARNLFRVRKFRSATGIVEWKGRLLPDLNEEFAMPYHNDCIRDLLQLSMDPKKLHDETLLATVVLLRTDEEMGMNIQGEEEDQQLFLKIGSMFVDAQTPKYLALPHSSPEVFHPSVDEDIVHSSTAPPPNQTEIELGASGLRQACFWIAFRQDLHAAFLKQQPVSFPLSRCEAFRQLHPATDAIWTNRLITLCADVLEFCYGSDSVDAKIAPAYTDQHQWRALRSREEGLCALLPATFEPTYCSEPNLALGSVFPEIWYLEPCHVIGTTYVELARMLLEVFNPTRPKLGHGFLVATNRFISSTKKILFRLCGIALSNDHCPPSLINACLGISMFGEYFEAPAEQDALLGVLALMNDRYAYPTSQIANALQHAWSNNKEESTVSGDNLELA
ncbi:hypothetical protein PMZ80_008793 [Knufia obscura]|uniref:Uncharacterized protein n=2 Tax=Knufia TaxID=430999 RepID=A0AAN8EGH7_9EURO|nr:hypothetical protein PMZ80_008793 [Knufia obscura]KAK5955244.1 hypothetical protein OHC33_003925 [Knufia fluminis]